MFHIKKADFAAALQIVEWNYPAPYHVYNLHGSAVALHRLVEGPYYAVYADRQLMGFFCYGEAARLRTRKNHPFYQDQNYLDVGLGMHPAWCGRGHGQVFVRSGLCFARELQWEKGFRLTVASNNPRALKVYSRQGFRETGRIPWNAKFTSHFVVMTLDNCVPVPEAAPAD